MTVFACGRCKTSVETQKIFPATQANPPEDWTVLTVTTMPLINMRLCPSCTRRVFMALDPDPQALEVIEVPMI